MRPAISVVVPFFDSERYIVQSVESLLDQKGVEEPYEIILVDNGSTDASRSLVDPLIRNRDGVTLLREDSAGAYCARNAGIVATLAPLIAFTDADCRVASDWLRTILDEMRDPGIGILVGHCRYPEDASFALRLLGAYENQKTQYVVENLPPEYQFSYANNMAVRASVFEELGGFEEWKRAADSELVHRLAAQRPELRLAYSRSMKITHMEFLQARARIGRLKLYSTTNSKITSFRELGFARRLAIVSRLVLRP